MDIRVINMPYSWPEDMIEVMYKVFCPAAAETVPFPLLYCNVIENLALRGTSKYFKTEHPRITEGFMTDEVADYIEAMKKVVPCVKKKKTTARVIFVSAPGKIYLPRPLQHFL